MKARHIPYKCVGPMVTDLIGGQVEFATAALPSVQAHLKTGSLSNVVARAGYVLAASGKPVIVLPLSVRTVSTGPSPSRHRRRAASHP